MKTRIGTIIFLWLMASNYAFSSTYPIPSDTESLIGQINHISVTSDDTATTVALRYDIGYNALEKSNPHLDMNRHFSSGTNLSIANQHLLPNLPRRGIIVNLPEMRMYYFTPSTNEVNTYPIGIGKAGKTIPITSAYITKKVENPTWIPPDDIREFNLKEQGIVLPKIMLPGPDNPLGPYAIYTSIPTYLIHSTIFPESVGKRASFGCIRMYETDIKQFFPSIASGIPVVIINVPVKMGWQTNRLYIEAHRPLEEHDPYETTLPGMVHTISKLTEQKPTLVDWQALSYIADEKDGVPHEIGIGINIPR